MMNCRSFSISSVAISFFLEATENRRRIRGFSLKLSVIVVLLAQISCTVTDKNLPENGIDDPVILPVGMSKHSASIGAYNVRTGNFTDTFINAAFPSYGLSKNWEMPASPFPYFRYLLNPDRGSETQIEASKKYQILEFGLSNLGSEQGDLYIGYAGGYQLEFLLNDLWRSTSRIRYIERSNGNSEIYALYQRFSYRLSGNSQGFISLSGAYGFSRWWINEPSGIYSDHIGVKDSGLDIGYSYRINSTFDLAVLTSLSSSLQGRYLDGETSWTHKYFGGASLQFYFWW